VTFHGYRPPEVFVPILAATHVCVSPDPPTPFNDVSTMTKVVEYLAIGRPVVAFDLVETASVLGPAGLVVPDASADALAAALAELAADRPRLAELTSLASSRLDAIDLRWEHSAKRLLEVYESLLTPSAFGTARSS
jgi:glycosyltransferase involved in cell wall biosynthesis